MPRVLVLGAGMVGATMALDLAADRSLDVAVADRRADSLNGAASLVRARTGRAVRTIEADLGNASEVTRLAREHDIVLGALSSVIGFQTLRAVIESRRPYCDISFMPENALALDAAAKAAGVCAVVDCGVAPGLSNLLAGYAATMLQPCESIEIYVGGLPVVRQWPFEYKAGFSPADVLEEYTRPARLVQHGRVVVRPALSEPELMDLPGVGTVEAFNTDGLRTLADTLRVPHMKEKTLRYPGHIEIMRVFRELGLFGHAPIRVGEQSVRPIDLTSALLFPKWQYGEGEQDLTVMRVKAIGLSHGRETRLQWDLLDYFDRSSGRTSMSRTTAFPATIIARELLAGRIGQTGVIPPELLGSDSRLVERVLSELAARGVRVETAWDPAKGVRSGPARIETESAP